MPSEQENMEYNSIRKLLSQTRRAVDEYNMIDNGDRIAIGLSGGKDSMALICALDALSRFYPNRYDIVGITVDMGFEGMDFTPAADYCADAGIPFRLVKTKLADVVFNQRKESNPCSLCSKMRRGILHDAALEEGCNKVALGHHFDDAVDTFMLNLIHGGRIASFSPSSYLSRKNITLIRPLIFASEKEILAFMKKNPQLPVIESACPADKNTQRETVKQLLNNLDKDYKGIRYRIFDAMRKSRIDGY
jgi:tRNA 2-thiocytidine biosynthesis protein TtcA